jgi:HAD superfamily hydrolase (TIGR01490 family)
MKLHIFDVDFTIVRCSTVREFIFAGLKAGLVQASIGFYIPSLFLQYTMRGSTGSRAERAYPFLRDVAKTDLERLARSVFHGRLLPRIDEEVFRRIRSIQGAGGRVIIASSSFGTILQPLAGHLGIDEIVATELEFRDGRTTGRVEGEPAFGEGKRSRVLAYLRSIDVTPMECAFYTDSHRDLPLLREVGEPIAVNPGARLRRSARAAGWEILDTGPGRKEAP